MQFAQHFIVPVWLQAYGTVSLAAYCWPSVIILTWWPPEPPATQSCKDPPKCVPQSICDNYFLQMWETPPAHDLYCNAHCDCQKNKNICNSMFRLGMHEWMTHRAHCMWQNHRRFCVQPFGTRAGANRPVISLQCHVTCVTARSTRHIWLCLVSCSLPKPQISAKQTDETLVTLCLPNFKSHTSSPQKGGQLRDF